MKKWLKYAVNWLKYIAALLEELVISKNGSITTETKAKKPGDPGGD